MRFYRYKVMFILITALLMVSCEAESSRPYFVTSSYTLTLILQEIAGTQGRVETLVPIGASPHTYTPKPSDIQKASQAKAFLYVDDNFDGWSKSLNSKNIIEVFSLLPLAFVKNFTTPSMGEDMHIHSPNDGHNHQKGSPDPHFWMDPIAVKALLPVLADTLGKIDPDNASLYKTNADIFAKKIDVLSRQVEDLARNLRGKQVFLYHPSILYMLNRYEMTYAGSIEEIPGKEPSAKFIANLVEKIKKSQTKAIFSEPQLPDKNAKILAQETGVSLYMLDPVGGTNKISKYSDLILYNIKILKKALE